MIIIINVWNTGDSKMGSSKEEWGEELKNNYINNELFKPNFWF